MRFIFTFLGLSFYAIIIAQTPSDTLTLFAESTLNKLDCYGDSTDITVSAWGGTAPYVINWENTTNGQTGFVTVDFDGFFVSINPAKGGLYRLVATDALSDSTEIPILISEPEPIEFDLSSTAASCPESMDATATLTNLNGGTTMIEDYQITWLTLPTQHDRTANNLGIGLQTVLVSDDKNCTVLDTVRIESLPEMQLQVALTMVSCPAVEDGKIQLDIQGGTAPYEYGWSENVSDNNNKNQTALGGGLYKLTVTDASQICQLKDSFFIEEPPAFEVEWSIHAPTCQEEVGRISIDSVNNATPPVYYSMNNLGFHAETSFGGIEPGFHQLYLKDANGCRAKESFQMPYPEAVILEAGRDELIILGDSTQLDIAAQSSPFIDFSWQPTEGLSCSDCPNPMAQPMQTTTYSIVATDSSGCVMADELTIWIQKNRSVYIPTAFSPDGTGFNDSFVVFGGQDVRSLKTLRIYNRWGNLLIERQGNFALNQPEFGWNGEFEGHPMPPDTYLYEVEIEFLDGEILPYWGEVYLIR